MVFLLAAALAAASTSATVSHLTPLPASTAVTANGAAPAAPASPATTYFTQPKFEFRTGYTEAVAEFDLPILNRTGKPLKLLGVETSCTCMKVALPEPVLAPGARGRVHCVFNVPNALGPVQKPVILKTDSPDHPKEVVIVRVDVPGILRATPERLAWNVGSPSEEKTLRITVADESAMRITKVECSRDLFTWSLQTLLEGREYELRVTPKDTARPALAMFLVQTDSSIPRQKTHSFYAVIEAPKPAAP